MGDCGVLTTLQHVSSGMLSMRVCADVYYLSSKSPDKLLVCHKHGFPGSLSDQVYGPKQLMWLKMLEKPRLRLYAAEPPLLSVQVFRTGLSHLVTIAETHKGIVAQNVFFSFLNEWSWIQTASCPKEGMNGLVFSPPHFWLSKPPLPPLLVSKTPLFLDLYKSVFYIPKDILITTGFTLRPCSSATDPFVFLNIPLFLLPFRLFLLRLWQICASFHSHKYGAGIHPNASGAVSIAFSVNI